MNYFQDIALFETLSESDGEMLSSFSQLSMLPAGEYLFRQWDDAQAMYVVLSWKVSVIQEGKEIARISPWELVGEMAFFDNPPVRNASVKALEETQLLVIIEYSIRQLLQKSPELHQKIRDIILARTMM